LDNAQAPATADDSQHHLTVTGPGRLDSRTKRLVGRLRPGDIAIINHRDLDAVAARSLIECQPAAIINADQSISGRYPNTGPGLLVDAGIPVLDGVGADLFDSIREGEKVSIPR